MDAMERSHTFESAVVSSLFNARQLIWTELSSVISDIKERFDRSNKERNAELNRLLTENRSLSDLLKRLREIIEGKELEINGLRRQLQGFYTGRPICSSCSRSVDPINKLSQTPVGSSEDKTTDLRPSQLFQSLPHVTTDARKRDRRNTSLSSNPTETNKVDSPPVNAIPWVDSTTQVLRPRHSQKRQCVRASLNLHTASPIVLLQDTQTFEDPENDGSELVSDVTPTNAPISPDKTLDFESERNDSTGNPVNGGQACDSPHTEPGPQLGISKLSPPTQSYDASLAIKNAVNHLDLANYEHTMLESIQSQATLQRDRDGSGRHPFMRVSAQVNSVSRLLIRRNSGKRTATSRPINGHFRLGIEPSRPQHHHDNPRHAVDRISNRHHRATCRHARLSIDNHKPVNVREPKPKAVEPLKPPKDLDETGADLSLPSDFLVSERSEQVCPVQAVSITLEAPNSKPSQQNPLEAEKLLPSLGCSPTRDAQVFKRPNGPAPHSQLNIQSSPRCTPTTDAQPVQSPTLPDDMETQLPDEQPELMNVLTSTQAEKPTVEVTRRCTVKYVGPVVRRHSVRREMPAHACQQCKEYYESMGLSSPEIASRVHRCSRHRALHGPPPSTPKGFWDLDISDCEAPQDVREIEKQDNSRQSLRRRRPLRSSPDTHHQKTSTANSA